MNLKRYKIPIIIATLVVLIAIFYINANMGLNDPDEFSEDPQWAKIMQFQNSTITYAFDFNGLPPDRTKTRFEDYAFIYTLKPFILESEKNRIKKALEIIENASENIIEFKEIGLYDSPNLVFSWAFEEECNAYGKDEGMMVAGLGGIVENESNVIKSSMVQICVLRYAEPFTNSYFWASEDCNTPTLEVHEILHAFGFGHLGVTEDPIMFPIEEVVRTCRISTLASGTAECLKYIYSNGKTSGNCSKSNIYPYEIMEEAVYTDAKWEEVPITYSMFNCDATREKRIRNAIAMIETDVNYSFFEFQENTGSKVNFYCLNDLSLNPDYKNFSYNLDALPASIIPGGEPEWFFSSENEHILEKVNILLYKNPYENSYSDGKCNGIEAQEVLHALGLIYHSGDWMTRAIDLCGGNRIIVKDPETVTRIKNLYNLG